MSDIDSIWKKDGEEWKKMEMASVSLQDMYDLIHPVDEIVFGYKPTVPTGITAVWEIQTTHAGKFLMLTDDATKVGTEIDQNFPNHCHSLGEGVALIGLGWDETKLDKIVFKSAGSMGSFTTEDSAVYEMTNMNGWGNSREGRMSGAHVSKLGGNTDNPTSAGSGKLRPDGWIIGEWKRVS